VGSDHGGEVMDTPHGPKHVIVVGIDGSKSSVATLEWAVHQAELTGSTLEVLTMWEWPLNYGGISPLPADYDPASEAALVLRDLLQSVRDDHPDVVIHSVVREGRPAPMLVEASREADLLVVGTHGRNELSSVLLGSVSEHCAHHALCPIVIIRDFA
jgi:nucleotide-binding universal stress UspA family protein